MTQNPNTRLPKTPRVKVYAALLTQSLTNAPVEQILFNNVGQINWSYLGVGIYRGSLDGAFPEGKVSIICGNNGLAILNAGVVSASSPNEIFLETFTTATDEHADNLLFNTPIEIKIYENI